MRHIFMALATTALATALVPVTFAAESSGGVDRAVLNRIVDEGLNHSELPQTAEYLADRIGGRMTNSPQMRLAEKWTQDQYRKWNLTNVRTEGFDFGRGWSIERCEVRMTSPRTVVMRAIPVAWTPPTSGTVTAEIFVAPMTRERDFARWQGKLRGKIVLVDKPAEGSESERVPFKRLTDEDLGKLDSYTPPTYSEVEISKQAKKTAFAAKRDAFLAAEGAVAWIHQSYRDGSLLHGEGYSYKVGETPKLPGIDLAAEDYRRLARLAKAGVTPTISVLSEVKFHDEDRNAYNVFADIAGRDAKAGFVMAGAHLDSWVAGDGAADNGAGTVAIMEAARILAKLNLKPKRTIRFALWAGEEQALLGSLAYVEQHLGKRAPLTDPERAKLNDYATYKTRFPITPLPEAAQLVGYYNIDNGSGKLRGIYTEGNLAVVPIFREWLEPFASMGVTKVTTQPTGGTDHEFMQGLGIPAFQFIQDPLDYGTRVHHSNVDTYDHLKIADLRQAAVVLASMLWLTAERDQPLPRMPVLRKPEETNPFSYDDDEE